MNQIAAGKRVNGIWHVRVKVGGRWYKAVHKDLEQAFTLATRNIPMGPAISQVVN